MPNRLLIKQFLRSGIAIAGISLLLLSGIISLFIGKSYLEKQRDKIEATAVYQQQHIDRNVQYGHSEMGLLLYYLRFAYVNSINPLNGLSIGQRDVNLGIQQVTIRNLIEKKYDSDLNNPASMVMGNLDFSFVLIYLFPLLIITFTYNLLSEEKEEGTWRLINIQSNAAKKVLLQKWWIRSAFVTGTLLLLYLLAIPILSIPINASYLAMIAEGVLYILFWFIACAMVVGWQKNSATNAVSLLSIWLLLTIVAPAVINSLITTKYPVPEAMATELPTAKDTMINGIDRKRKPWAGSMRTIPSFNNTVYLLKILTGCGIMLCSKWAMMMRQNTVWPCAISCCCGRN